jgi:hypothetical protein
VNVYLGIVIGHLPQASLYLVTGAGHAKAIHVLRRTHKHAKHYRLVALGKQVVTDVPLARRLVTVTW